MLLPIQISHPLHVHSSRTISTHERLSGFRDPGKICLRNPESRVLLIIGIRNPSPIDKQSGPGCSKLGWDNVGLVRTLNSDLKAKKQIQFTSFCLQLDWQL